MAILKSINYWSFPGGWEGELSLEDACRLAKDHGFEAIELCVNASGALHPGTSETDCRAAAVAARANGVSIPSVCSALYWDASPGDPSPQVRAKAIEQLKQMIRITHWLGARTLLTIPAVVDIWTGVEPNNPYDQVVDLAREAIDSALPLAAECEVRLGIENVWNKFLLSPLEMQAFVDQFQSPWVGAYVDVANMLAYGYPEQWLRILGKRVVGIHFKDYRRSVGNLDGFVDLLEGDVNWPEVMKAIQEIGYDGPVVAEMIPLYRHYPIVRVANASRAMDAILGRQTS